MSDNLLREAIADAKAVRETAIANAKLSLEEAFKPHLASMISTRLRNEAEGVTEQTTLDSSDIGTGITVKNPAPKQPSRTASDSSEIENPGQELKAMGKGKVVEAGVPGLEDDPMAGQEDDSLSGLTGMGGQGMDGMQPDAEAGLDLDLDLGLDGEEGQGLGMQGQPDELDLESIIRELELDVKDNPQDGTAGIDQMPPAAHDGYGADEGGHDLERNEGFDSPMAGKEVDGAVKIRKEGGLPGGKADAVATRHSTKISSPGQEVADTRTGLKSENADDPRLAGEGSKKVTPGQEVTTEEVDLDEILREMEAEESASVVESSIIATENVKLKRSLREHREVVQFLRSKLQEVNMLNAKLLYTNKLFKGYSLTGPQKMRVVETFDRATTMREVKLIYTTLAESMNGRVARPVNKTAKTITEGMASRPTGSTKPKSPTILAEGNDMVARMQKLAGINQK